MVKNKYFTIPSEDPTSAIIALDAVNKVLFLEQTTIVVGELLFDRPPTLPFYNNITSIYSIYEGDLLQFHKYLDLIESNINYIFKLDKDGIICLNEQYKSLLILRRDAIRRADACFKSSCLPAQNTTRLRAVRKIFDRVLYDIPSEILMGSDNIESTIDFYLEGSRLEAMSKNRLGKASVEKIVEDLKIWYGGSIRVKHLFVQSRYMVSLKQAHAVIGNALSLENRINQIITIASADHTDYMAMQYNYLFDDLLSSTASGIDRLFELDKDDIISLSEPYKNLLMLRHDTVQRVTKSNTSKNLPFLSSKRWNADNMKHANAIITNYVSIISAVLRNDDSAIESIINESFEEYESKEIFKDCLDKASIQKIIEGIKAFYM